MPIKAVTHPAVGEISNQKPKKQEEEKKIKERKHKNRGRVDYCLMNRNDINKKSAVSAMTSDKVNSTVKQSGYAN